VQVPVPIAAILAGAGFAFGYKCKGWVIETKRKALLMAEIVLGVAVLAGYGYIKFKTGM
jgi:hypothetical protein